MNRRRNTCGQTMTEYLVIMFALIFALFVPWGGQPSVVATFLNNARVYHAQASFPLSLP